jgi:Zn-dependent peptidase ImmA (M78 family)
MLKALRKQQIEDLADKARCETTVQDFFPIDMRVVCERVKDLRITPRATVRIETESMVLDQAYTVSNQIIREIVLSKNTYDELDKSSRANFTLAHELGHLIMHDSKRALSRAISGKDYRALANGRSSSVEEVEANYFAAAFLMPKSAIKSNMTPEFISEKFRVSIASAQLRLNELFPQPRKLSERSLQAILNLKLEVKKLK